MGNSEIRGRFAPTPSGRMHLGNAFCALIAWLSVRSQGGEMVLRIEDLDRERCSCREYVRLLEEDLLWLGLDWEEGSSQGGTRGPYEQSACTDIYEECLERLKKKVEVYPCFCTRAELHAASAPHLSDGRMVYSGHCRGLTSAQREALGRSHAPAWRVQVPEESVTFEDGCCGPYTMDLARECGDFVIRRSDGTFAYQFAVVVDDGRMGITEVVRGSDLLSSTPQQIWLHRLLGFAVPKFYHVPLLTDAQGRRLSKRDRDLDLGFLRGDGIRPQDVIGLLAHASGLLERFEPLSAKELIPEFSWKKLRKGPVHLSRQDLEERKGHT